MVAVKYNISIEQGSTYSLVLFSLPAPTALVANINAEVLGRDTVGLRPTTGRVPGDLWYDVTGSFTSRWSRWAGSAWENVTPNDLTNWSARMHFRNTYDDASPFLALTSPTVSGNGITLGGQHGSITINMSAAQTTALDPVWLGNVSGVYDLELYDGSSPVVVNRISQGTWGLNRESTR